MWIIPKTHPLYSVYAADMVASKEDLNLPGLNIESSLMWRSKPSQLKTWCQRWNRVSWLPHLYTRILKPCQRISFETELTSYWGATRVSLSRKQGNVPEQMTKRDTSGRSSEITSEQLDLFDVSLKMSKDTSHSDSERSLEIWKNSVTKARGAYLARKKSMPLIKENGFLSWATPNTMDHLAQRSEEAMKRLIKSGGRKNRSRPGNLREQVNPAMVQAVNEARAEANSCTVEELDPPAATIQPQTWPTPSVMGNYNRKGASKHSGDGLATAVKSWPTPRVVDTEGGTAKNVELKDGSFSRVNKDGVRFGVKLKDAVDQQMKYPTPNVSDSKGANMVPESDGVPHDIKKRYLRGMVFDNNLYPTPTTDSATNRKDKYKQGGTSLSTAVNLQTPTASDYKNMDTANQVMLSSQVKDKKGYALSPDWVEKMMGVPPGWTALDGTSNQWDGIESWADGSWDSGPRVVEQCENRVDRIRLLGNGVVPATAAKAWIILEQQLNEDSN